MSIYSSTTNRVVNSKYIIQIDENGVKKIVLNPSWTPELDVALKKATKVKYWNPTPLSLLKLQKANRKKELPVIFENELTSEQIIQKLKNYMKLNHKAKIDIIGYLLYCIMIHGLKKLYPSQGHIGAVIGISRGWSNEMLAELEKDGFMKSLYRHLCSKLYSLSASIFNPDILEQLSEFFPWIKYHDNKVVVAEFTQQINFRYINNNLVDNVIVNNVVNFQKREMPSKFSSEQEKNQNLLTSITSVLCAKMKAF